MNNPSVQWNKKSSIVKTRSHFKSINGFFKNAQHITVLISENSSPPSLFSQFRILFCICTCKRRIALSFAVTGFRDGSTVGRRRTFSYIGGTVAAT